MFQLSLAPPCLEHGIVEHGPQEAASIKTCEASDKHVGGRTGVTSGVLGERRKITIIYLMI